MIDVRLLRTLYPDKINQLSKTLQESPTVVLPVVTRSDAEGGFIDRYFVRAANDNSFVMEVDKKQYDSLKQNPRFVVTTLRWKIVGKKENINRPNNIIVYGVADTNRITVANADLTFGGLRKYIQDYTQFWVAEKI